jgi:hypothetical protein
MKFQAAYSYLKRGHKIKLPEWGGYWYWKPDDGFGEKGTIIIRTRYSTELDIRDTSDLDYTISFMFRDDWELVEEERFSEVEQNVDRNAQEK